MERLDTVMKPGAADGAAAEHPGSRGDSELAQIGVRGLETTAVIERHGAHSGDRTGEGHGTSGSRSDGRSIRDCVVNAPMSPVGTDRGELSNDRRLDRRLERRAGVCGGRQWR